MYFANKYFFLYVFNRLAPINYEDFIVSRCIDCIHMVAVFHSDEVS